jgi:16S rRNA (cytosine1402-N4)-methyltransferase
VHDNFFNLTSITKSQGVASVAGILLDLGWSTPQFEERNRGFSFEGDEYLDMRYDPDEHTETAYDIINTWSLDNLQKLFKNYGEEKLAQEISEAILAARSTHAITTTKELVEIILMVYRKKLKSSREIPWIGGLHPATKVFQALRIQVNRELDRLEQVLPEMVKLLAPGGRLAIITFHSLEDRIVKQYFKKIDHTLVRLVTKKPIVPTSTECTANPRARSAKLRVVEKI